VSDANEAVWTRLTGIFRDLFDDDSIELTPATTADDIEDWDSVTHIELLVEIERAFGIRFNTGEVAGLENVGEMADLIGKRVASAAG
jgi:acyl carrier protein